MRFTELELPGAWLVEAEPIEDERGWFARTWCAEEFAAHGLDAQLVQCNRTHNRVRHTVRGMHWQAAPHGEVKLVSCGAGALHDVIVDLRAGSPTLRRWTAVTLSADDGRALYVPAGFAHGFLTLEDATTVNYQMSTPYVAEAARGARWDDPALSIDWPATPAVISERDRSFPLLDG